jgi:hypothetical protein
MRVAMLFLAAAALTPAAQAIAQSNDSGEVDVGSAQQNGGNSKLGLLGKRRRSPAAWRLISVRP